MTHNADLDVHLQNKAYLPDGVFLPSRFLVWFQLREEMPPVRPCESLVPPGSASLGPARTLPPCVSTLILLAPLGSLLWLPGSPSHLSALSGQKSQAACDWDYGHLQEAFTPSPVVSPGSPGSCCDPRGSDSCFSPRPGCMAP